MKASVLSLLGAAAVAAAWSHQNASTTSTVYSTTVYTVTSCAPTVTDCPARMGQVTTDIISLYTTVCPVTETESSTPVATSTPAGYITSTVYTTTEYTITSCPPTVTNCPVGSKTKEVLTSTTVYATSSAQAAPTTSAAPTSPASSSAAALLSTVTYTTCVPTVITSVYTVTATPTKAYSTGASSGFPVGPKNTTVPFVGAASANKAGGLLLAVGLAAALL